MQEAAGYCNLEFDLESGDRGDRYGHAGAALAGLTGAEAAAGGEQLRLGGAPRPLRALRAAARPPRRGLAARGRAGRRRAARGPGLPGPAGRDRRRVPGPGRAPAAPAPTWSRWGPPTAPTSPTTWGPSPRAAASSSPSTAPTSGFRGSSTTPRSPSWPTLGRRRRRLGGGGSRLRAPLPHRALRPGGGAHRAGAGRGGPGPGLLLRRQAAGRPAGRDPGRAPRGHRPVPAPPAAPRAAGGQGDAGRAAATLAHHERGEAAAGIPVWRAIARKPEALRARAEAWREAAGQAGAGCEVIEGRSAVGGGSLPDVTLPTSCWRSLPATPTRGSRACAPATTRGGPDRGRPGGARSAHRARRRGRGRRRGGAGGAGRVAAGPGRCGATTVDPTGTVGV